MIANKYRNQMRCLRSSTAKNAMIAVLDTFQINYELGKTGKTSRIMLGKPIWDSLKQLIKTFHATSFTGYIGASGKCGTNGAGEVAQVPHRMLGRLSLWRLPQPETSTGCERERETERERARACVSVSMWGCRWGGHLLNGARCTARTGECTEINHHKSVAIILKRLLQMDVHTGRRRRRCRCHWRSRSRRWRWQRVKKQSERVQCRANIEK